MATQKQSALRNASFSHLDNLTVRWEQTQSLRPSANNPRTHSKRQLELIARSLKEFGWTNPIVIDENKEILAGHGRWMASNNLKFEAVPVIQLSHMSEAQKRAYRIADNQIAAKAGWDDDILKIELQFLAEMDFDLEVTGFEGSEADNLIGDFGGDRLERDDVPALQSAVVCKPGEVWQLGDHRLVCGDARNSAFYRSLLGPDKARFVITDPPYNVPIEGHASGLGRVKHANFQMASGELSKADFVKFLSSFLTTTKYYCRDGAIIQTFMDWRHIGELIEAAQPLFELKNLCVWVKPNGGMGSFYRSRHELIFVWKSGRSRHVNNFELGQFGRSRTNVWEYAGVTSFGPNRDEELGMHPTIKPVELIADAIKDCSKRGDIVLDPFGGSGTILIASEITGRRARAIELDARYCDVAIRRWQTFTRADAINCNNGLSFEKCQRENPPATKRKGRQ